MDRGSGVPAERANWITKLVYRALKKRMGLVSKTKQLVAYDTSALLASTWMDGVCAAAKTVPFSLKELAQLKVAALVGCPF